MKVKILFVLLSVSLAINVVIFYGFDLVEKGSMNSNVAQLTSSNSSNVNTEDTMELSESENASEAMNTNVSEVSDKPVNEDNKSTETDYIYYLTNDKIDQAIQHGKTGNYRDEFTLPLVSSTSSDSEFEYMDLFITTPYKLVSILSSNAYMRDDRTITRKEAKEILNYDHISFTAYVLSGWANMFAIELTQDNNIIEAYDTINSTDGDMKNVYFNVEDIDFREPAILKIFEKSDPEKYSEYKVSFENYIK